MPSPTLLQRLKERKLVQWALAYLAGAWVVYEGTGTALEAWAVPVLLVRSIHVLLIIGFLVTLILAWYHGEKGRQRVSGPELMMVAALLVVAGVALAALGRRGEMDSIPPAREGDHRPGLAVLPCTNMSPDPEDEYFAAGLHDEILLKLQRISSLLSIGRTSVLQFAEDPPTTEVIASALGVDFVGECSVRKEQTRVRVIFQLLDGRTGGQLWAEDYDRDLTIGNLLDIESHIAQQVAREVGTILTPDEQARITARPTESLEAYDFYIRGMGNLNRFSEEGLRRSIDDFNEAIAIDSTFALAYVGLADAYLILGLGFGLGAVAPEDVVPRAKEAAQHALDLDPECAQGYTILGMITYTYDFDFGEAQRLLDRALELGPNLQHPHAIQALLLSALGRHDEAVQANRRSGALDPLRPITALDYGYILLNAGRLEEAMAAAQHARELAPEFSEVELLTASVLVHQGRYEESIAALRRVRGTYAENPRVRAWLGFAHAELGDEVAAREILGELLALAEERYVSPKWIGFLHMGLGEDEAALDWFERAVEVRADWMIWVHRLPGIDRFQSHRRFQDILGRMNLGD
jgi:serine/threonine-protein kinase